MSVLDELDVPIVLAPLAGGPATVALASAVSDAGGLGFLAAGYRTAAELRDELAEYRRRTGRPVGVNVFAAPAQEPPPAELERYVAELAGEAARAGVALGEPRSDDDEWEAKLAVLADAPPEVVSFVFGCPPAGVIADVRGRGSEVWITVTTPDEAQDALAAGADALVVQGLEAGGHRGGLTDPDPETQLGLLALLQLVRARVDAPLVAAGGIATGRGVAGALAAGARAASVGTAFMLTPEAGTADVHRATLAAPAPTGLTRAFTGRLARGIVNRFMREHGAAAPRAYPQVHHVTAPLRRAGRERGDGDVVNLWAGQAHELARGVPAAEVVRTLAADARRALADVRI